MKELIKHIGKPQFSWFLVGGALFISVLYVREIINFWFAFGFAIVLVIVNERLEDYSKREEGVEYE